MPPFLAVDKTFCPENIFYEFDGGGGGGGLRLRTYFFHTKKLTNIILLFFLFHYFIKLSKIITQLLIQLET